MGRERAAGGSWVEGRTHKQCQPWTSEKLRKKSAKSLCGMKVSGSLVGVTEHTRPLFLSSPFVLQAIPIPLRLEPRSGLFYLSSPHTPRTK